MLFVKRKDKYVVCTSVEVKKSVINEAINKNIQNYNLSVQLYWIYYTVQLKNQKYLIGTKLYNALKTVHLNR